MKKRTGRRHPSCRDGFWTWVFIHPHRPNEKTEDETSKLRHQLNATPSTPKENKLTKGGPVGGDNLPSVPTSSYAAAQGPRPDIENYCSLSDPPGPRVKNREELHVSFLQPKVPWSAWEASCSPLADGRFGRRVGPFWADEERGNFWVFLFAEGDGKLLGKTA
ncbi:hypothetical protein GWK47_027995 [Chionoecetes opilio]|uniref:Uncharacterized protein n=1 Tax=Chionoecetes opilio TaxID=41210 RepID=A0A8J4YYZ0_CHIOP|nr:hypothetical protein GWK47_027995 [Chionoecetes opilio]